MPELFPPRRRVDDGTSTSGEPIAVFLARSANPVFARVRDLLEAWHGRLPAADRPELTRRLSGRDDREFTSAWAELYVRTVLEHLGCKLEQHPVMRTTNNRPDYRAHLDRVNFLVEVTVLGDGADAGQQQRRATVVAELERDVHPDFALVVDITQEGQRQPPMKSVRADVRGWLDGLDWEDARADAEQGEAPLEHRCESDRWRLTFGAWPRMAHERGEQAWPGIIGPSSSGVFDHPGALHKRLSEKAARYGELEEPLLLAVQTDRMAVGEQDVDAALKGRSIGVVYPGSTHVTATPRRTDGLWRADGRTARRGGSRGARARPGSGPGRPQPISQSSGSIRTRSVRCPPSPLPAAHARLSASCAPLVSFGLRRSSGTAPSP